MFGSWDDIEQKFEVFLFMCGIMEDPSPVISHMCEQYAMEMHLEPEKFSKLHHLFEITKETRSKEKFLNPFCNDQIYHVWQLPLEGESECYIFGKSLDRLQVGDAGTTFMTQEMDTNISHCEVYIRDPCLPPHDVLQAISTLTQSISCLYIGEPFISPDEICDDIPYPIFDIDPSAYYINMNRICCSTKAISQRFRSAAFNLLQSVSGIGHSKPASYCNRNN